MFDKDDTTKFEHWRIHGQLVIGLMVDLQVDTQGNTGWHLLLYIPGHIWCLEHTKEDLEPCPTKPGKPSSAG